MSPKVRSLTGYGTRSILQQRPGLPGDAEAGIGRRKTGLQRADLKVYTAFQRSGAMGRRYPALGKFHLFFLTCANQCVALVPTIHLIYVCFTFIYVLQQRCPYQFISG